MPVSSARRTFLMNEWREVIAEEANVKTAHPLAPQVEVETLFVDPAVAQTEANRLQTLRGVRRDVLNVTVELNDETQTLDLGDVINLKFPRFGLTAGKLFTIIGIEPDGVRNEIVLTVWG